MTSPEMADLITSQRQNGTKILPKNGEGLSRGIFKPLLYLPTDSTMIIIIVQLFIYLMLLLTNIMF